MATTTFALTPQQRRLRGVVKQLVIELAHVEAFLAQGGEDKRLISAAQGMDGAIDALNDYLDILQVQAA
ncbi:hypothetical protein [Leptolyngbya sp. PCC 6406]|uniref:hypothetical protein n=1 Tax=Leptolyngbya sp. PCC 6406 TaxID=1173264 RepID=UPI0002ACFC71|nr:hypothetical protein [Leptolyngbya sp. PCC 6406]